MEIQQFQITARLDYTPECIDQFIDLCENAILSITEDTQARFLLKTAIDELTQNAIEHGYQRQPGCVTVSIVHCGDAIRFEISDLGRGIHSSSARLTRVAQTDDDLYSRGWAFSILESLSGGVKITPNDPQGTRISFMIPLNQPDLLDG